MKWIQPNWWKNKSGLAKFKEVIDLKCAFPATNCYAAFYAESSTTIKVTELEDDEQVLDLTTSSRSNVNPYIPAIECAGNDLPLLDGDKSKKSYYLKSVDKSIILVVNSIKLTGVLFPMTNKLSPECKTLIGITVRKSKKTIKPLLENNTT